MSAWSSSSNIGDCLTHLHFLMKLGGEHSMWVKPEYIGQISEVAHGSNVTIHNVWERPEGTTDFWRANGMLEHKGVYYRNDNDICGWLMDWFNHLGGHCGHPCPVYPDRQSMLWDSEVILNANVRAVEYDVLIINSPPTSGQCPEYDHGELYELGLQLRQNGLYVVFAQWDGSIPYTLRELGKLSLGAKLIIESANGPCFLTHSIWNSKKDRITLLSPMYLDYGETGRHRHAANVAEATEHCQTLGYL
jgi:hypothetical protein